MIAKNAEPTAVPGARSPRMRRPAPMDCGNSCLISGRCGCSGACVTNCPEGQRRPDDGRQGDSGKIAENCRWRGDADCDFPQVENGVRDEPQRRRGPQPNAVLRSDHTDAEGDAE